MMNTTSILSRLQGVTRNGDGWKARCPAHDDKNPSLSITEGDDGRTLLKCFAGCTAEAICDKLNLTLGDLFPPKERRNGSGKRIVATYDYHDASGKVVFQVARFEPKDFRQRKPDATATDGWTWNTKGVEKVLFRLPEILRDAENGKFIFVCEGEKDALAMAERGFSATCNPGGAGKWQDNYSDSLRGAAVVIVPDKDAPGRAHSALVAGKLKGIAKSVRVMELPDVDGKPVKDAFDFFAAGGDAGKFFELVDTTPEWTPANVPENGAAGPGIGEDEEKILPFPLQHLPPAARAMAEAIARTERTPETLAGCCVLGIMSASIGAGLQVTSGPNRVTRANLYIGASAESGTGKSETFRHAAKPFFAYERELIERWKAETLPGLQAEAEMLESEIAKLKKDAFSGKSGKGKSGMEREEIRAALQLKKKALADVNAKLIAPALCCEDVTSEKLAVMLAHNQEQLASLSPDAGSIVNNLLGRYSKLDRTDEGIYVKTFSGDNCRVDRQGREPVLLQRPCLAALWLVQPDKLETLLGKTELTDGGMIPRLLVCHTRATPRPIVDGVEGIPAATANAWAMLVGKLIHAFRMASEPFTIEPTPEAWRMMKDHHNQIVARRLGELRDVTTFAARWNEQAWRIAVCLHAGLHGEDAGGRMLAADTAASAIALADWFAGEQLRILARGRHAARRAKLDEVLELLADNPKGITARDVQRKGIEGSADEARALLTQMETDGELTGKDSKPETGGHITRTFTKARK